MNLTERQNYYKKIIEARLEDIFHSLVDTELVKAMQYSVENGGKRLRPVLMLLTCELLGVNIEKALPFACALEIIHSSSLVHDDLPALDNDDLRRGKPSCHKQFGEAQAILCGDALLNLAYEICHENTTCIEEIRCIRALSSCTGYSGMLGGQYTDIVSEKKAICDKAILESIQLNKTAKLIIAPVLMASELAGGKYKRELVDFGTSLGIAFQIVDDILDAVGEQAQLGKTVGKDIESGKLTDIKIYGIEQSKLRAKQYTQKALDSIKKIEELSLLIDFAKSLTDRVK